MSGIPLTGGLSAKTLVVNTRPSKHRSWWVKLPGYVLFVQKRVFSIKRGICHAALALWRTLMVLVRSSFCESRSMSRAMRLWMCSWVRTR